MAGLNYEFAAQVVSLWDEYSNVNGFNIYA